MVVDFHTHAFPNHIAARALSALSDVAGLLPFTDGTLYSLRAVEQAAGIHHCAVLNIATSCSQQHPVNDFAASMNGGFFTMFGSVHPDAPDVLDELDRIAALGLKGIKLHPQFQGFYVDEPRMIPIYEKAGNLGLITVFHAGEDIGLPDPWRCTPQRLRSVIPTFGGAPLVAAHLGGFLLWDDVERFLVGQNVYLDTSYCYGKVPMTQAARIARNHGTERILFGSDLPWSSPADEMRFVRHLGVSDEEEALILGGNAARLLGLGK